MNNAKLENMLNLALDATEREREKSMNLDVGYDRAEETWELIVKYSGDLTPLRELGRTAEAQEPGEVSGSRISVVELQNEYAIVTVPESMIPAVSELQEIEYIEKPKRLFFSVNQGRIASCMTGVQNAQYDLFGDGILVCAIDSGIDIYHPDFRNADGTTRILALWDQTIPGNPPEGYVIGTEYTKAQIDEALRAYDAGQGKSLVPSVDNSGHGTRVMGIAAGNGRASNGQYRGVASRSPLLVVKLGIPREQSFPRTTELMQGLDYCIRKAIAFGLPAAVNISFGNTYGPHDGTSLLETYITDMANRWKSVICIGTGNEGAVAGHTSGVLREPAAGNAAGLPGQSGQAGTGSPPFSGGPERVELAVGSYEPTVNVQIWKSYLDDVDIMLTSPGGVNAGPIQKILGPQRFTLEQTEILLYYGEPAPYSEDQEIYIEFLPRGDYINEGIWTFTLVPREIRDGRYGMWLPSSAAIGGATRFLYPVADATLTIPSTARKIIAVGAYDSRTMTYADFSGRGSAWGRGSAAGTARASGNVGMSGNVGVPIGTPGAIGVKPNLVAPGVDIMTAAPGGGYAAATGTSFATPFVTGAAALLMQWGITDGNDPFLYGEKVKAYLQKGARPLPAFTEYPNPQIGWGTLCVRDSLPG